MFFTFTSETTHDEAEWNAVFSLEVHVHGALREGFDTYATKTEADLFKRLTRFVRWAYKQKNLAFTDSTRGMLRLEMPHIMAFLAAHRDNPEREEGMFWARTLRADVIRECGRRSPAFLNCLQDTGETPG